MLNNRYADRVVVITGGAGGIGLATATRFAAEGAKVVLLDIDGDRARQSAETLEGAIGVGVDITNEEDVQRAVDEVIAAFGAIDVLVNNAGIIRDNLIFKMTAGDWDAVMSVHLKGAFLMTRAVQKHMVQAGYGRIVNLTSIAATGNRGQVNYSAAKAGLNGFTKTLALELGQFGITANSVGPGFISTAMTDATAERLGLTPEAFRAEMAQATPVKRVGQPEDVATAITFLASEEASFITGQVLYVDGGLDL